MSQEEWVDLVDEKGGVIGSAPRAKVHGDPSLLHPVVHCVVESGRGEVLLQLRDQRKQVQPGKWDTAVGGHVERGESVEVALGREMDEELGIDAALARPVLALRYIWRTGFESELVYTFRCTWDGPLRRQQEEIQALRYWGRAELDAALGTGVLTPNLEHEYTLIFSPR